MKKLNLLALSMLLSTSMMMVQASDDSTDNSDQSSSSVSTAPAAGAQGSGKFATMKQNFAGMTADQKKAAMQQKMQNRGSNITARQQKLAAMKANGGPQGNAGSVNAGSQNQNSGDSSDQNVQTQGKKAKAKAKKQS